MIIVANWKAYISELAKAKTLCAVSKRLARATKNIIVLAPPAPLIGLLISKKVMVLKKNKSKKLISERNQVNFSAQDVSVITDGANTGEITAVTYAESGATYAIIGHSERRATGDTNQIVAQKLENALSAGLTPILCVGEKERDSDGKYLAIIREEITSAIEPFSQKDRAKIITKIITKIIIAYEPLWAIGRDAAHSIHPNDLMEMVLYIRKVLSELLTGKISQQIPVLYGGAVEAGNARDLAASSGINGFLIGHASVDPDEFSKIIKSLGSTQKNN